METQPRTKAGDCGRCGTESGSFCYYSEKQKTELEYHSATDLKAAKISRFRAESCRPWAFEIRLPARDWMEYEPGIFAAPSQKECNNWVQKLKEISQKKRGYAARRVSLIGTGGYASGAMSTTEPQSPRR